MTEVRWSFSIDWRPMLELRHTSAGFARAPRAATSTRMTTTAAPATVGTRPAMFSLFFRFPLLRLTSAPSLPRVKVQARVAGQQRAQDWWEIRRRRAVSGQRWRRQRLDLCGDFFFFATREDKKNSCSPSIQNLKQTNKPIHGNQISQRLRVLLSLPAIGIQGNLSSPHWHRRCGEATRSDVGSARGRI